MERKKCLKVTSVYGSLRRHPHPFFTYSMGVPMRKRWRGWFWITRASQAQAWERNKCPRLINDYICYKPVMRGCYEQNFRAPIASWASVCIRVCRYVLCVRCAFWMWAWVCSVQTYVSSQVNRAPVESQVRCRQPLPNKFAIDYGRKS